MSACLFQDKIRDLTEEEIEEFTHGNPDALKNSNLEGSANIQCMAFDKAFIIAEVDLIIGKDIEFSICILSYCTI